MRDNILTIPHNSAYCYNNSKMETNKKKENKIHVHIHRERNKTTRQLKNAGTNVSFVTVNTVGQMLQV
jgi:hypothetical protein